ncbi:Lacal_2735 family protein [Winogradskyella maritima]|uniref:Lacal_2735 family protein n=1 Tax=Winogradskyella maritima TaxID=1517766 RepID=A0ABV8AKU0_9FLAO|nr:Lacal_2735 family protein [Winogradskyella maritima]
MSTQPKLREKRDKLKNKYAQLAEDAYNLRQTDHALSDLFEFKAMKVLHKLRKLRFLERDLVRFN